MINSILLCLSLPESTWREQRQREPKDDASADTQFSAVGEYEANTRGEINSAFSLSVALPNSAERYGQNFISRYSCQISRYRFGMAT